MKVSGDKIKALRESLNKSREEVAIASDKTVAYIGKIERGESQPTVSVAYSIAKCLGVVLDELLIEE